MKLEASIKLLQGKDISKMEDWIGEISSKISEETLVINLVIKFAHDMNIVANGSAKEKKLLEEEKMFNKYPLSSTQFQEYVAASDKDANNLAPLGKPIPNVAGLDCATGQAQFNMDIPKLDNELFFGLVSSTAVHADLVSVDPSEALKVPGVVRFISAK